MNLSEVKNLKDGDSVIFMYSFPKFTLGGKYTIRDTPIGKYITDDNGLGYPLADRINVELHFEEE